MAAYGSLQELKNAIHDSIYENAAGLVTADILQDRLIDIIDTLTSDISLFFELPVASASVLGAIKVGDNLSIDVNGVLSATTGGVNPFQSATFANPLNIDGTTYKDWVCASVTGSTTVNLNSTVDGDAGMIELIMDSSGGHTITFGTMFTKKMGLADLDNSANADNIISWRNIDGDIMYTIGVIEV